MFEVIPITQELKDMIQAGESVAAMKRKATELGMNLLGDSAAAKVAEGITSLDEAISLCNDH